ncbi:hypothetical protein AVEN_85024-1 [Araneus ventricosus]|uniref:Tc1-like transposase DDE domain-containing protein n=1 Tax=Araneus ventricosus TaxID=182803 RepID=A0A4Y2P4I0_ARAVE|nr:hypothetical protein AVEN_85024-1 [Araneus ventricosus]
MSRIAARGQVVSLETFPPYSSDLAPNDSFLFPKFKEHLAGTRFSSDTDVKTAAENCLNGQGRDFYQAGLNKLVLRSDKYLNRFVDNVEQRSATMTLNPLQYFLSIVNK